MSAPTRDELRAQLVAARIAGDVATSRDSNIANLRRMLAGHPNYGFGLQPTRQRSESEAVALMAARVGIDPDPGRDTGTDVIDPDLTIAALDRMAQRLGEAAAARQPVLVATGHPTGLLVVHQAIARALAARGCEILAAGDGVRLPDLGERHRVIVVGGVHVLATATDLLHTHSPEPMRASLQRLEELPGLVVADHGWAGAAAAAGVPTVGFADCNDPALFVGEADGTVEVAVPLDDNVRPQLYEPMTAYLLRGVAAHPTG